MSKFKGESVTFDIRNLCKYTQEKIKKRKLEYYVYVEYQVKVRLFTIHKDYRKRFGIESS